MPTTKRMFTILMVIVCVVAAGLAIASVFAMYERDQRRQALQGQIDALRVQIDSMQQELGKTKKSIDQKK
jgi:type II secretory pathway pseudopilin PulG